MHDRRLRAWRLYGRERLSVALDLASRSGQCIAGPGFDDPGRPGEWLRCAGPRRLCATRSDSRFAEESRVCGFSMSNSKPTPTFQIEDLRVAVEGKQILNGVDLMVNPGEVHALMGPNGSGKSTLANTLMGHPKYQVLGGRVLFQGENLLGLPPDQRAKRGLFLAFQYPVAIPGV